MKLFFYGTLLHSFDNALTRMLSTKLKFEAHGTVLGELYWILEENNFYPALVKSRKAKSYIVHGAIYETTNSFSASDLAAIDKYEEFYSHDLQRSEYRREEINVMLKNRTTTKAQCYIYNYPTPADAQLIKSGSFTEFIGMSDNLRG